MNGKYLLDTNILIALFQNDSGVRTRLREAAEIYIPVIVLGELYYGAAKSGRPAENLQRLEEFARGRSVLECDASVAREYGAIKNRLREKGRPIPENDVWIAATARRRGLVLVTRDDHFQVVEDLGVENW